MKAISILGTSSNAGKSWIATALCAWLQAKGHDVAPFKAQNMGNNAYATLEGGEIGVAQAIQAEACERRPIVEMNPILLKPSSASRAQVVRLGKPGEHLTAQEYYQSVDASWETARSTLDYWKSHCDVLIIEGAGSPVELNLMDRDIANLRPIEYVNGKWILVADIERGGSFAQVIGTWNLLPEKIQKSGLGFIINKFRGDPALFSEARDYFQKHTNLPFLGVIPFRTDLRIEDEDSLNAHSSEPPSNEPYIAWVRYPHLSNTQDQLPWQNDKGISNYWVEKPAYAEDAIAIVLPGTKEPIADLAWLRQSGFDEVIQRKAQNKTPIVGICGGYQILGQSLKGSVEVDGLGLLPISTKFLPTKKIQRYRSIWKNDVWETFEIHTGETKNIGAKAEPLLSTLSEKGELTPEGMRIGSIWGTYQHGLFESPQMRKRLLKEARFEQAQIASHSWRETRQRIYQEMGEFLDESLDLTSLHRYLDSE
ncbi:MAG: cobyric acid synthase [Opitutaceae bacterium]|nr:cobyric acid synthase [Opitutaceae bacterium]